MAADGVAIGAVHASQYPTQCTSVKGPMASMRWYLGYLRRLVGGLLILLII